jgi:N6-L-threonylcarbamoyladenine synthase
MLVLGIETSCDETGLALYDTSAAWSRIACTASRHAQEYGGVVPELASRDHVRHLVRLTADCWPRPARHAGPVGVAYTAGRA